MDAVEQQRLYKKTLIVVIMSQIFGGAGLAAGVTVGALLARDLLGSDSVAGLPAALFTLGSALAAYIVGHLSQRKGRRIGLAFGFYVGAVGAIGVIAAAALEQIVLLFFSLFIYGAGTATNLQARYAGTDLASPATRGKAISMAMVFTTIGAVAGPNLVTPTGTFAEAIGLPALTGPFLLAAVAYFVAGAIITIGLRPDPLLIAKQLAKSSPTAEQQTTIRAYIVLGALVMIVTQIVMVAIMTMTPLHMTHHGHSLGAVGIVIGLHIAAMYLPSLITGKLVDRWGRWRMIIAAAIILLSSGIVATFAPADSVFALIIALMLLGLGWNFGLISGTALIIDGTPLTTRAKTQGTIDVGIAIFGASASISSGILMAMSSYGLLALISGLLSIILIPAVYWAQKTAPATPAS